MNTELDSYTSTPPISADSKAIILKFGGHFEETTVKQVAIEIIKDQPFFVAKEG